MPKRLPPLNALRAFEAAARHLSLTRAARELSVTPAAVSHQVKALEEYLGVALFRRSNRSLLLTDAGQAALPALREGFERLAEGVAAARASADDRPLTVTVPPTFGARWLVPRLDRFTEAHPGIEVRLDASMRLVDLAREDVDLAVRYGAGEYPGLRAERLLADEAAPVCSPRLLEGPHPLREPADLCHHVLLHVVDSVGYLDWRTWLRAAGVAGCDPLRGPSFAQLALALEAAIDGQGVVLAGLVSVQRDLEAGRLVKPFDVSFPVDFAYHLVWAPGAQARPAVAAFREWIRAEAARGSDAEADGEGGGSPPGAAG